MSGFECKHNYKHGSDRTWFRWIASRLPISTGKPLYIRIPGLGSPQVYPNEDRYQPTGEIIDRSNGLSVVTSILDEMEDEDDALMVQEEPVKSVSGNNEEEGVRMAALKAELHQLKVQIAQYALAQMEDSDSSGVPPPPPAAPPAAPPPPPPPPLPLLPPHQPQSSSGESTAAVSTQPSDRDRGHSTPAPPDISQVLNVKLRKVEGTRSPGGTPLRPTNANKNANFDDPASIIAEALRRKFSNQVFTRSPYKASPDKENWNRSDLSEFDSPTAKLLKK